MLNPKKNKLNRLEFLDQLVVEFQETKSQDAKRQVIANLANFAYDPSNYNFFRELNILDLFLDHLLHPDDDIVRFAIGGLCNCGLDPKNKAYILKNSGLSKVKTLLRHSDVNVVASAITTLMFLMTPESKKEIITTEVLQQMINLQESPDTRLKNLAKIFLKDFTGSEKITLNADESGSSSNTTVSQIPLPQSQDQQASS